MLPITIATIAARRKVVRVANRNQRKSVSVRRLHWLTDVLGRIADYKINKFDELLPWRYAQSS